MEDSLTLGTGLTRNQFLIWLGQEAARDKPIFNEMSVFVILGELDVARFQQAFARTLDEVDALRTRVIRVHGRPRAEVLDHLPFELGFIDLSDQDDVEGALDGWARARVDAMIDLSIRSFESKLIKLAPDKYAWALVCHQVLTDATSMSLVFERVSSWYLRLSGSDAPSYADEPGFQDYVKQELKDAQSARHQVRKTYWAAKVSDPADPAVYYEGRSASFQSGVRRVRVDHSLGAELTAAIRSFATQDDVRCLSDHLSTYSIFCAALILYLHKLSGHGRVTIGTTWHNRPRRFRSTVGLFMVQNPFEVEVDPHDTFLTLIKKVQSEAFSVMRHLPYAAGNPGGRSYDVTLNYVKVVLGPFAGRPVEHRWYRPSYGEGSLQMQVHDVVGDQDLTVSLDLGTDVFTSADRDAVVAHYVACLESLIANPDQTIGSASILTSTERERLARWNDTRRDYPCDATVVDLIDRQTDRRPGVVAASCGDEQLTYAQLRERVRSRSRQLRTAGVGPGVFVGVLLHRSLDLLVGLLAVLDAGGTYVPLDPAFPRERLDYMLEDSGARVLLTETRLAGSLDSDEQTVVFVDCADSPACDSQTAHLESRRAGPDDLAYVLYTSGSTGRPKGVEIPHRALTNFLCSMAEEPGCTADDSLLAVTTLSFDIAGLELYLPLVVGGRVEIANREQAADGRLLRASLDTGAFTILQATPVTWRMLLDAGWKGTAGLKALIGGEALPAELVQPLLDRTASLWNMYGPTETTIWSSVQRISPNQPEITIGRPIANTGFHIMDAELQQVPIGVAGELLISGDGLARGYHNRPELTPERFVDVSSQDNDAAIRMYRTGDLARFRADGQVVHLGRLDQQVKVRGFRIELGEIETILATHESVQKAVVSAHGEHSATARLVAHFVPIDGESPTSAELRRHLQKSLPDYMVPRQFVSLSEVPLTLNGKIDRNRLPMPRLTEDTAADQSIPLSPMETRVAAAFCDVLELSSVPADADFFELGGQSLLALRLVSQLGEEIGVEVPLQMLFEASTVSALSRRLDALTSTTPELRTVTLEGTDVERRLRELWRSATGSEPPSEGPSEKPLTDVQVIELLRSVRQTFGVAAEGLSALAFRSDPTVSGLARALHEALNPPQALIVPLQPHGHKAPLFLIHAGGGYVFFYRALAARLGPDQPVYAIRAATRRDEQRKRFDRTASIEELAASYINEIKTVQPEGPYNLGGACLGGVVAFEMAQQLLERGESVGAPILLFDSFVGKLAEDWGDYASRTLTSVAERLGADGVKTPKHLMLVLLTSTIRHPVEVLKLAPLAVRSLFRRGQALLRSARVPERLREVLPRDQARSIEQEQLETMRAFLNTSLKLVLQYEPKSYPGPAVLLKATVGLDPEPLWTSLVTGPLKVHVTPGEHLDMMEEPWVEDTADLVERALSA